VPELQEQETCDEVHSLAIVKLLVYYCIRLQDIVKVLSLDGS
jgi:hypothetical protein